MSTTVTNPIRVLELAERLREHLAHRLVHPPHTLRHSTATTSRSSPQLELLPVQPAHRAVEEPVELAEVARRARDGEGAALPEVAVRGLRDRGAEAVLELRLRRADEVPLALERPGLGEVELDREDPDVAGTALLGVVGLLGGVVGGGPPLPAEDRSVRSISRVS